MDAKEYSRIPRELCYWITFLAPQQNLWVAEVGLRQMIRSVLSG